MTKGVIGVSLPLYFSRALKRECEEQGLFFHSINWNEIINNTTIECRKNSIILKKSNGFFLDVTKIAAVICFDISPEYAQMKNIQDVDDRLYVYSAWRSFWLYATKKIHVCLNRFNHKMLSPCYLSLPYVFKVSKGCGFQVPSHSFSSYKKNNVNYTTTANIDLFNHHDFRRSSKKGFFAVEYVDYDAVVCLSVVGNIIAVFAKGGLKKVFISKKIRKKIKNLSLLLGLEVMEIFFRVKGDVWVLYRISPSPQWDRWWVFYHEKIAKWMVDYIIKNNPVINNCYKKENLFIDKMLRPNLI